jgi:peptide/nickel transport system substrate-binding protein
MKRTLWKQLAALVALMLLIPTLAGCAAPEAEVVERVVTQVVVETVFEEVMVEGTPQVVEKEVTKVVEVEVEKVVTPTPEPTRKIVTIAWTQEPDTLNPFYTNMWYSSATQSIWSCWAWQYDDTNAAYPHLVTEIPSSENGGVSEDGLTITLNLRDDITWSDGTPITSADFVFTYEMIMDPGNSVSSQYPYDYLNSVEAPDDLTVVMNFSEPFASWQSTFWTGLMPRHVLEPVFAAEGSIDEAEWNMAPTVGCGPFVFDEWESGSYIRFVKSDNYWLGQANLDEVFFQFVPDDNAQTAACIAGDVDLGFWPPLDQVPLLQAAGLGLTTQASGYNEGWFINFGNNPSPGMEDVRVRQAIAMALDREAIAQDLLLGLTPPNETFWDALPSFVSPDIVPWEYDPEAARALLEEAGWTDTDGDGIREDAAGNDLTLTEGNTTRQIRQDVQAVAQQMLLEVGIDLQIFAYDADILFASYSEGGPAAVGDLDIMEWSDVPYFPDPDSDYWLCSQMPSDEYPWGYNYFGCDETLDELFQRQIATVNAQERAELFYEITQYMHDQVYYIGMWEDPDIWIINERLVGTKFSGVTPFYNMMEWDVTD